MVIAYARYKGDKVQDDIYSYVFNLNKKSRLRRDDRWNNGKRTL